VIAASVSALWATVEEPDQFIAADLAFPSGRVRGLP